VTIRKKFLQFIVEKLVVLGGIETEVRLNQPEAGKEYPGRKGIRRRFSCRYLSSLRLIFFLGSQMAVLF